MAVNSFPDSDSASDAVLSYLNARFDKSVTPITSNDGKGVSTVFPQYSDRWRTASEILTAVMFLEYALLVTDLDLLLLFLIKRELIKVEKKDGRELEVFCITYEGRHLIKNGGFKAQTKQRLDDAKIANRRETSLIYGTWVAGIGAIGVLLIELWKRLGLVLSIEFLTLVCVAACAGGVTVGVIIFAKEVRSLITKQKE